MSIKEMYEYLQGVPEEKWAIGTVDDGRGHRCALGLLAIKETGSSFYMSSFLYNLSLLPVTIVKKTSVNGYFIGEFLNKDNTNIIAAVNNGETAEYQQETPKKRILAYLQDCMKEDRKNITKELAILPVDETSDIKKKLELV